MFNAQFTYYRDAVLCLSGSFPFFLVASLFCLSARVSHYCLPVLLASKDFQLSKMASTVPDIPPNPVEATYLLLISSVSASKTHFVTLIFYGSTATPTMTCVCVCVSVCITRQILVLANLLARLSATQWWRRQGRRMVHFIRFQGDFSGCCPFSVLPTQWKLNRYLIFYDLATLSTSTRWLCWLQRFPFA